MNKDRVDISFVVPAYNEEKFIEQCLASILK
ncbi:MAG: glycosyltransferase, partial [Minisyncoccia bacterium]